MSLVAVYDALKEAKVSDDKAAAAVEALESSQERYGELRADIVRMQGETNERIADLRGEMDRRFAEMDAKMDRRFAEMDAKMEKRLAEMDAKMDKRFAEMDAEMDRRFAAMDVRIGKIEADIVLLKWMFGFILASLVGILLDGIFG